MACVVVLGDTPVLVVGEFCSRWSNANCQSLACTAHKIIEYGSVCKRGGLKCEVFDRINNNFVWICADVVACVVARCCVCVVHDSIISEQPGVVLAVHQDDVSGLTCIGYRGISE